MPLASRSEANPVILVVDDDPAVIYAARALLGRRGCRIEAAFKGLDAVARVRAGGLHGMLLDVEMPEVDGLSVLESMRPLTSRPPVVLMADRPSPSCRSAVEQGLALAVLGKPVDFAHAHVLLTGVIPEQPLALQVDGPPAAVLKLAREALASDVVRLPEQPALP